MENDRLKGYGIGCFLTDCIAIIDLAVDLRSGRLSILSLLTIMLLSVISVSIIIALIKQDRRRKKEQFQSRKVKSVEDADKSKTEDD